MKKTMSILALAALVLLTGAWGLHNETTVIKNGRGVRAMSQADLNLTSGEYPGGKAYRDAADLAREALVTNFSGENAPNPVYPCMWWANTSDGYLYQANVAADAWRVVRPIDPGIPLSTGVAGIYEVTYSPALTVYKEGVIYPFKADKDGSVTNKLTINSGISKWLRVQSSNGAIINCSNGDLKTGKIYYVYYDLVNDCFVILNKSADKSLPKSFLNYDCSSPQKTNELNIGTVTKNGTGDYTVELSPGLSGMGGYSTVTVTIESSVPLIPIVTAKTASSVQIKIYSLAGDLTDPDAFNLIVFE